MHGHSDFTGDADSGPDLVAEDQSIQQPAAGQLAGFRQGKGGRTHLVSPEMAAAAAVAGKFVDIRQWPGN